MVQFVIVALSCIGVVTAVRWGVSDGRSITQPIPDERLLLADGYPFHRIPVRNLHRRHGRHRA